jgi:exodeoxyribonuclease III
MKLLSWNVNGIRAAERNGFLKWFESQEADLVALQEIKANPEQLSVFLRYIKGYSAIWHPAKKPGYSGVALFTKQDPLHVALGMGIEQIDTEGRVLIAEYPRFTLINAYFPNSQREHTRLDYKIFFCKEMLLLCERLRRKGKNLILCGDFNIAHKEIDLRNPKSNFNNAGFLPRERAWLDQFTALGYIDTFRFFNSEGGNYTWWSYRPGVREKNIGWRLDYIFVNPEWGTKLVKAEIQDQVFGSDHCPVLLQIKN